MRSGPNSIHSNSGSRTRSRIPNEIVLPILRTDRRVRPTRPPRVRRQRAFDRPVPSDHRRVRQSSRRDPGHRPRPQLIRPRPLRDRQRRAEGARPARRGDGPELGGVRADGTGPRHGRRPRVDRGPRAGDDYVINGEKWLITNSDIASHFIVFAKTTPPRYRRFWSPATPKACAIEPLPETMGCKGGEHGRITLVLGPGSRRPR